MSRPLALLDLDLRSPLDFFPRTLPAPSPEDFFPEGPKAEGEESLYLFGEGILVHGPDGPACPQPLDGPLSAWGNRRLEGGASAGSQPRLGEEGYRLDTGHWLFMQWRPASGRELREGIEWLARESWWEGRRVAGPLHLRLVREDRKLAWQLLWRLG